MKHSTTHAPSTIPVTTLATSRLTIPAKLRLNIRQIPAGNAHLMIAVFADKENFMKIPVASKRVASASREMTVEFDLPLGEYSVMMFQDRNGDGMLNRNSLGIPTEPWTTSARAGRTKGEPTWWQTRFVMANLSSVLDISF